VESDGSSVRASNFTAGVTLGLAALLVVACKPRPDLNTPCSMPRRTDAGVSFVTERQVRELIGTGSARDATRDFIAFGSLDCEDLVCVRDATFVSDAGLDEAAKGYCSKVCDAFIADTCQSSDPALDQRGDTRLGCRPLLLDQQTLEAINQDPVARRYFPNPVKTEFFCARGAAPDAGL